VIMESVIYAYAALAFASIVVMITLFIVARLLDLTKSRPLPGSQSRIMNTAIIGLVCTVVMLLLVDLELIAIFPSVVEPLRTLVESIDLAASAIVALVFLVVLFTVRRAKKP
jgi:hypothetical protein